MKKKYSWCEFMLLHNSRDGFHFCTQRWPLTQTEVKVEFWTGKRKQASRNWWREKDAGNWGKQEAWSESWQNGRKKTKELINQFRLVIRKWGTVRQRGCLMAGWHEGTEECELERQYCWKHQQTSVLVAGLGWDERLIENVAGSNLEVRREANLNLYVKSTIQEIQKFFDSWTLKWGANF